MATVLTETANETKQANAPDNQIGRSHWNFDVMNVIGILDKDEIKQSMNLPLASLSAADNIN